MNSDDSRESLMARIGRLSQLGGISSFEHVEGNARGTSTLRVRTARGLEFWIVPDRGMDIYEASFMGRSLCWHSPTGMVHPSYYSNCGLEWLKTFAGGLLTTCGLTTAGAPSEDNGEKLALHGPIANTPAEHVSWSERWESDDCIFSISGRVREASVHGDNLLLERTISTSLHSATIAIHDRVENQGFKPSPLMILYHLNFGFPFLTPKSWIHARSQHVTPVDSLSADSIACWNSFESPRTGQQERVYFHEIEKDSLGRASVVLVGDHTRPDLAVSINYDATTLPEFTEWKMTGSNHYVLGLEPGNCRTLGRAAERERGALQQLAPGEHREFRLELRVLSGTSEVAQAIQSATAPR